MALKTIVKVGNISNLSDARYCAGMGVQYLGFSLDRNNQDYVDKDTLKTMRDWVVGPVIAGELLETDLPEITEAIEHYDIDCIEISKPEVLVYSSLNTIPVILRLDISDYQSPEELRNVMDSVKDKVIFFLLDKSDEAIIQKFDILTLATHFKIMIGYGIDTQQIASWINGTDIFGIELKGSTEIKPGFKDYDLLADILEMLEIE